MAEAPAAAKEPVKTILNRSTMGRVYHLKDGRVLLPGNSADVGLKEFAHLTRYRDLADADKVVPQAADKLKAALSENADLKAQVDELRKQLEDKGGDDKKGKK